MASNGVLLYAQQALPFHCSSSTLVISTKPPFLNGKVRVAFLPYKATVIKWKQQGTSASPADKLPRERSAHPTATICRTYTYCTVLSEIKIESLTLCCLVSFSFYNPEDQKEKLTQDHFFP